MSLPIPSNSSSDAKRIRVLVVDDSALARKIITRSLETFPDIEVVGTAIDPYVARDKILELSPDVVTLDIEMPRMDGLTFLKVIMKHRPMPVIIMSSLTEAGSAKALEALRAGAVDVMGKPSGAYSAEADGTMLAGKIRAAAVANIKAVVAGATVETESTAVRVKQSKVGGRQPADRRLILLGASTGGTQALQTVLAGMSAETPGICIVQHIPAHFSKALAERLNQICAMEVREARHGDAVEAGLALLAPGGQHLALKWRAEQYVVELSDGPRVHYQRPSVDIMFDSAVKAGGGRDVRAALLTGMGVDGAAGLLQLREAGAVTVAQDEATSVVYGMPGEAVRLGAAQHVLGLERIGPFIEQTPWANHQKKYECTN